MSKDTHDYTPHGGEHLMTTDGGEGYEKLDDKIWPSSRSASDLDRAVIEAYRRGRRSASTASR